MKKYIAAAASAAAVFVGQGAYAQPVEAAPGTPAACSAQWQNMMDSHTTGDETRHHFMRHCVNDQSPGPWRENHALGLLFIAGTIAVIAVAASDDHKRPVSP